MNWQPHFCQEEITAHRNGSVTRYVRHWIFGVLVRDTFPKRYIGTKVQIYCTPPNKEDKTFDRLEWTEIKPTQTFPKGRKPK
jgi:hypothetical protein